MGQITTTQNLVAIKEVRHAGQQGGTQWICPTPPIIENLCANIFRENIYDYVLEDLPSKLDDKTYDRSEKFIGLLP